MVFESRFVPPADLICKARVFLLLLLLWSELSEWLLLLLLLFLTSPTIVSENVPPQDIAGTDGNHGDRFPVGTANDVPGRND